MRLNIINVCVICILFLTGCAQMNAASGWSYLKQNKPDLAIQEFSNSLKNEQLPGDFSGLIQAYTLKKDYQKAKYYLDQGLSVFPDDWSLNYTIGLYYLNVEANTDKAIDYFQKTRDLKPASLDAILVKDINDAQRIRGEILVSPVLKYQAISTAQDCLVNNKYSSSYYADQYAVSYYDQGKDFKSWNVTFRPRNIDDTCQYGAMVNAWTGQKICRCMEGL